MNSRTAFLLANLAIPAALALAVFAEAQAPRMVLADAVYTNAAIYTVGPSRHISPIFGILGERLCAAGDFQTVAIAIAIAAGGKCAAACRIRRETK